MCFFCAKRFEEDVSIFGWSLFSVMCFAVIVVVLKENFVIAALRLGLYCAQNCECTSVFLAYSKQKNLLCLV